eukprot:TRINITY_DN1500_c0_g1_i1.p1 TRINITY_DN1500_c0_g1~~TRINITY_DN1500_c0_g1_i1.p1  ORF type:complete len:1037 (-),score=167.54 TRINITY_DN1500_c0_g1_i1:780-3890(-)
MLVKSSTIFFAVLLLAVDATTQGPSGTELCSQLGGECSEAEESGLMQLKMGRQEVHVHDDENAPEFLEKTEVMQEWWHKRSFFKKPKVMHEWVTIEYDPMPTGNPDPVTGDLYQANHCVLTGIKICNRHVAKVCKKEVIFTTTPRWAYGVPYTLHKVVKKGRKSVMQPWPNIESQEIGNCDKIQYVQSMEIAPDGVMWVIDAGHKYFTFSGPGPKMFDRSVNASGAGVGPDGPDLTCPPKMVLIDIATGKIIQKYVFPESVAARTDPDYNFGAFLNDIVIDTVRQVAYISDLNGPSGSIGGIIVYDRNGDGGKGRSRRFHDHTTAGERGYDIFFENTNYTDLLGGAAADAIGLSPSREWVYYGKLGDPKLYKVSAAALADVGEAEDYWHKAVQESIVYLGDQHGIPDGIAVGENGMIFGGGYNKHAVSAYEIVDDKLEVKSTIQGEDVVPWIDTFSFDNKGYLWMVSNKLNKWFLGAKTGNAMDFSGKSGPNFRILKVWVDTKSYICGQEGVDCDCGKSKKHEFRGCKSDSWGAWSNCYRKGNTDNQGIQWRTRVRMCKDGNKTETQTVTCTPLPLTCPTTEELKKIAAQYDPKGLYSDTWGEDGIYGLNPYPAVATAVLVDTEENCGVCYEATPEYLSSCLVGGRIHKGNTMQWPFVNSPVVDAYVQWKPTIIRNTTCKQLGYLTPIGVPAFYYKFQLNLYSRAPQERWNQNYPSGDQRLLDCDVNCWWDTYPQCNTILAMQPNLDLHFQYNNTNRSGGSLTQQSSSTAVQAEKSERRQQLKDQRVQTEVVVKKSAVDPLPLPPCPSGCTCSDWSWWGPCQRNNNLTRYGKQSRTRNNTCNGNTTEDVQYGNCTTYPPTCRTAEEVQKVAESVTPWGKYSDEWGIYDGRWGQNPYPVKVEGVLVDDDEPCGLCYESSIQYIMGCLVGNRQVVDGTNNWPYVNAPVVEMAIPSKPRLIRNTTCREQGYLVPIGNPAFYYKFQANLHMKISHEEWDEMYPSGDQRIIDHDVNWWWDNVPECYNYFQNVPFKPLYQQP